MKIEFLDVLRIFELILHLQSKLTEIWNIASIHKCKKSKAFFLNIVNFWFYANFTQKNVTKTQKLAFSKIFSCKIGIKSKVYDIFQKNAPDV